MDMYSALADPTRRHILELLAQKGSLSASDIYDKFDTSHPAISQHLKVLRGADLVSVEKQAQKRLYQINPAKVSELAKWIHHLTKQWDERFDRLEKVLKKELQKTSKA